METPIYWELYVSLLKKGVWLWKLRGPADIYGAISIDGGSSSRGSFPWLPRECSEELGNARRSRETRGDPRKDQDALLCFIHTPAFTVGSDGMEGSKIAERVALSFPLFLLHKSKVSLLAL